tara:strand:+ start:105 stop:287 length:183 start_codon:yes stop_codon:yes gene_type:complete
MEVIFPKDEGNEGARDNKEPKWLREFCNDHAEKYIIQRCDLLMEAGRYKDTEAIQNEFDY